jgi:uncharacterized membrane protein YhhN
MPIIVVLYIALALAAVLARQFGWKRASIFKGLPVLSLIAALSVAWLSGLPGAGLPYLLVVFGLALGFAGDILFLDKGRYFKHGVIAFLAGHLLYIASFACSGLTIDLPPLALAAVFFGFYAFVLFTRILKKHAKYVPGAIAYMAALMAMTACAHFADAYHAGEGLRTYFYLGALLFSLSDGVLSYRTFKRRFRLSDIIVLSTYYAAQGIIAYSAWMLAGGLPA